MDKHTITMTRSPDLNDDEVRHRLAQVYSLLIALGRQANGDAPASDGTSPVANPQAHDTPASIQEQA